MIAPDGPRLDIADIFRAHCSFFSILQDYSQTEAQLGRRSARAREEIINKRPQWARGPAIVKPEQMGPAGDDESNTVVKMFVIVIGQQTEN